MNSIENFLWHSRAAKYFSASKARRESFDSLRSVYLSINSRALCSNTWLKNCNKNTKDLWWKRGKYIRSNCFKGDVSPFRYHHKNSLSYQKQILHFI